MQLLEDGIIAFLAAVGVAALIWLLAGALLGGRLCRSPGVLVVLPQRGDGIHMEAQLRQLLRLRRELCDPVIVLADCGLSREGRDLAQRLCRRYEGVALRAGTEIMVE